MSPQDARATLTHHCNIPLGADFHALHSSQVAELAKWADFDKYRAPKNANGSRLRYYHAHLQRQAARHTPHPWTQVAIM